ncbi:MAG: hypothetical protein JNM89_15895 [Hyphomicrobiaceae bacterium]|nr:hypothetical protein [Hyphomicrobiaceae bacterium]
MRGKRHNRRKEIAAVRKPPATPLRETIVSHQFHEAEEFIPNPVTAPLTRTVNGIVRNTRLIVGLPVAAMILTATAVGLSAPRYVATAMLQVGLVETERAAGTKTDSNQQLSPEALSNLEIRDTRILRSDGLANKVVARLGLDKLVGRSRTQQLQALFGIELNPEAFERDRLNRATADLTSRLDVKNEARTNLIQVSVADTVPERAAQIVNALVAEFVLAQRLKKYSANAALSRSILTDALLVYGDRHPTIVAARAHLALEEKRLERALQSNPPGAEELTATGYVDLARPPTRSAGPGLLALLFLALLGGFTVAVGIAVALEWQVMAHLIRHPVFNRSSPLPWMRQNSEREAC